MVRSRISCWWRVEVPTVLSAGRADQFPAHVGKGGMKVGAGRRSAFAGETFSNSATRPAPHWSVLDACQQIRFVVVARDFLHQAPPFGNPFRDSAAITPPRQPPGFVLFPCACSINTFSGNRRPSSSSRRRSAAGNRQSSIRVLNKKGATGQSVPISSVVQFLTLIPAEY